MAITALRLLQQLTPRFSRPAATTEEALETQRLAEELLAIPGDSLPDKQAGLRLREKTVKAVVDLAAALSRLADKHGGGEAAATAAAGWPQPTHHQLLAAGFALLQCARLGQRMSVSGSDAARIAAAAQLMLRASPHDLAAGRAALSRSWLQPDERLLLADYLAYHCVAHTSALLGVFELLAVPNHQHAAAAFASGIARPEALLALLHELAQALLALPTEFPEDEQVVAQQAQHALKVFGDLLNAVLVQPAQWSQHAAAIPSHAALQQALAAVLLTRSLPSLAAKVAAEDADAASLASIDKQVTRLARAIRSPQLLPAAVQHLRQPGSLMPVVAAAVGILQALPEQCPAADARQPFTRAWTFGVQLLMDIVRLADISQPRGTKAGSSAAPGSQQWQQVADAVLRVLPRLAAALLSAAGAGVPGAERDPAQLRSLAVCCGNFSFTLKLLFDRAGAAAPAGSRGTWVRAAAAGLRLQPLLVRLDPAFRQLPNAVSQNAAQSLSANLLHAVRLAVSGLPGWAADTAADGGSSTASGSAVGSEASGGSTASGSAVGSEAAGGSPASGSAGHASLAADCAALHNQLCRLTHYLCGDGAARVDASWDWLLQALHTTFVAALQPCLAAPGSAPEAAGASARTLCATHWAALDTAAAAEKATVAAETAIAAAFAAADAAAPGRCTNAQQKAAQATVASLLRVAEARPGLVAPHFMRPARNALEVLIQDHSRLATLASLLLKLAGPASTDSSLACSFVCDGLLEMAAVCAALLSNLGEGGADRASALLKRCSLVTGHLAAAGSRIGNGTAGGRIPAGLAQQAAEAAKDLLKQHVAFVINVSAAPAGQRAQQLHDVVPAAQQVAAVVELHQARRKLVQARQLELARAAAGRSCAFLRCSNLQAGGNGRIVAGVKGLRCSACRAVWYCGTDCSHADWRQGGHRRMCKLLGEERRARKAAQQAAAAANAEADGTQSQ